MWILLSDAFLSVVTCAHDPDKLLVRARHEGDIPAVFSNVEVVVDADTDYPYRALVSRTLAARAHGNGDGLRDGRVAAPRKAMWGARHRRRSPTGRG